MSDGKLIFDTFLDDSGLTKGIKKLDGKVAAGLKIAGAAIGGATAAIAGLGIAAVKVGSGFEASMSQVAATMGITANEISAGSAEFELLTEAAKKAGETTKFSASQSAEALNYLALAGYDAEKAAGALPAVLDLAAAGGLELAYASDLATDAMAALGIEATSANLTAFGDKLAKTSQKANTSVAQLGEAILTVGGTAKSLAGGTTELNTVLGVLANRGIKGSEAGTKLRNIILALSAPTDKAAGAIKALGLEIADAEGSLRPINEVFKDLDASMSGMSDMAKADILNTIFNKQDLAAVQNLLAGCGEEFDNLVYDIENSSGAMSDMAATQMDNLKGDIDILKSALEGLGISFYESKISDFARNVVQTITDMVGQLSEALKTGGVEGFSGALGDILSEGITKIAQKAPELINAGVNLISSFVGGLNKNADKIAKAAVDIGKELVKGLMKIIPQVIDTAGKILKAFAKELGNALPALKPFTAVLGFLADHLNVIIPLLISAWAAFKVYQGISTIVTMVNSFASALVKLGIELGIVTVAQNGLNIAMAANPVGIVIVGIAALVTALTVLNAKQRETASATAQLSDKLSENAQIALESAQKQKEAQEGLAAARNERLAGDLAQLEATKHLADELEGLIDADGRVRDSEEDHAQTIIGELNEALGLELTLVDGLIEGEEALAAAIDAAIEKKKAQMLLSAYEEEYLEALKNRKQQLKELAEAQDVLAAAQGNASSAYADYIDKQREFDEAVLAGGDAWQALVGPLDEARTRYEEAQDAANKAAEAERELRDVVKETTLDIVRYEDAQTAAAQGRYEDVEASLMGEADAYELSKELIGKSEDEKLRILEDHYEEAVREKELVEKALEGIETEAADRQRARMREEVDKAYEEWHSAGENAGEGYVEGIESKKAEVEGAVEELTTQPVVEQVGPAFEEAKPVGENITQGIASGIQNRVAAVTAAVSSIVNAALAQAKSDAKIHSPSRLFRDEVGVHLAEGVAAGLEKGTDTVLGAVTDLSNAALKKAWEKGGKWSDIGANYAKYLEDGIKDNADDMIDLIKDTVDDMVDEISEELDENSKEEKKAVKKAGDTLVNGYKEAINDGLTDAKELIARRFKDVAGEWQSRTDDILKKQESMRQKLADFGGDLFEIDEEDNMSLKNINDNIAALEKYDEVITSLMGKGISDGLLSEIMGMDIDKGTKFAEILDSMGEAEFLGYIETWETQQTKAREISAKFFADEIKALDEEYTGRLNEALEDIPEMVKDIGINTVQGLADGMLEKMGSAVDAAARIADAIKTKLTEALEIHSPSRWAKRVIAGNTLSGISLGFREGMPKLKSDLLKSMEIFKEISGGLGESPFGAGTGPIYSPYGGSVKETHTKVVEREKVVGITFNGRLKDVARLLKPSLDDEDRRTGRNLVKAT